MKIAVTGKGGVGKTTMSALIAAALQKTGYNVLAIDADPDSNLLACMGHPEPGSVPPLVELKELIEERTGVKPGTVGAVFRLNPQVSDIPEKYAVDIGGIKVLVAGAVKKGGTGCYCPENAFVRTLVAHSLLDKGTALVLDMEAGVEHLSRGTIRAVDKLLVVIEPGRRSVETFYRIKTMADNIGLSQISVIGNRIRSEADRKYLEETFPDIHFAGFVPYDERLREAEIKEVPAPGASESADNAVMEIIKSIEIDRNGGKNNG